MNECNLYPPSRQTGHSNPKATSNMTPIGLFCWSCGFFTEEGRFKEERESRNEMYKATQPMRDDLNKEMKENRLKKKRVKR